MTLFSFSKKKTSGLVGVAMGSEGVTVAHVTGGGTNRPRLENLTYRPCPEPGAQAEMLARAVNELGVRGMGCIGVLEPMDYSLMLIEAPEVEAAEMRQAVRWHVKDLIDFHVDDAVIDVFDVPRQRERGRPKLIYVVAARSSHVRRLVETVEAAQLELRAVDIAELALRNVMSLTPEDEAGAAFLSLAMRQGLVMLTRQNQLYLSRKLDIGMGHGVLGDADLTMDLDALSLELQRSFDYCESHFDLPTPRHLLVAPASDDQVRDVLPYLAENLGVNVRCTGLEEVLECREPLAPGMQSRGLLSVGAALRREDAA